MLSVQAQNVLTISFYIHQRELHPFPAFTSAVHGYDSAMTSTDQVGRTARRWAGEGLAGLSAAMYLHPNLRMPIGFFMNWSDQCRERGLNIISSSSE